MLSTIGLNAIELLAFLGSDMKLKHLGSRTTSGTWVISGLEPMVPVILTFDYHRVTAEHYAQLNVVRGSQYNSSGGNMVLGVSNTVRTCTEILVPTETELVLNISDIKGDVTVHAFTAE